MAENSLAALEEAGNLTRARTVLEEAVELARGAGDPHAEWLGRIVLATVRGQQEPDGATETLLRQAEAAIAAGEAAEDAEVLAWAWRLAANAHNFGGRMSEYARALERALPHAREAGDLTLQARVVQSRAPYYIWGPGLVEEGLRFVDSVLAPLGHVPGVHQFALHVRAHMRARLGEFDRAFEDMIEFRNGVRDRGHENEYAFTAGCLWDVCLWAGDWKRGEEALREGYELLEQMGNKGALVNTALDLGDCVFRQGMLDEAKRMSEITEDVTAEDDVFCTIQWLTLTARVRAASGDPGGAETFARRAVDLSTGTEFPELAAEAWLALAETLGPSGDPEAPAAATQALELYERKGNLVGAGRVRAFIDAAAG